MKKHKLNVPKDVEYISDWNNFRLFEFPYILNKQITGCGFTQWCITNDTPIILCSPRKILLENKYDNYIRDISNGEDLNYSVYYAKNNYEKSVEIDKDLNKKCKVEKSAPEKSPKDIVNNFKRDLIDFYQSTEGVKTCKILVTYDSFRLVKETLESLGVFDKFQVVVDEMQSIFIDSRFKSSTELEFVKFLQGVEKVCYVSATPMMEEYLEEMDEFKNLPWLDLDWGALDPGRISKPKINHTPCSKLLEKTGEIIKKYRTAEWKDSDNAIIRYKDSKGIIQEIQSKEAIFYINSVKNICDIIRKCNLKQEECNILCADTPENQERIRKAFKVTKKDFQGLGKVPNKRDMDKNKMFTFCTRTVYLGADFWSTNARSYVFSDANVECLAVDITLDLPQILGRQRNEGNPWKNELNIYYKPLRKSSKYSKEEFDQLINDKITTTNKILNDISSGMSLETLLKIETAILADYYSKDYVSIDKHEGTSPIPKFNKLVLLSEKRAFEIQQVDFADRCSVRRAIYNTFNVEENSELMKFLNLYESLTNFIDKIKLTCDFFESNLSEGILEQALISIDEQVANYIRVLGVEKIRSHSYIRIRLDREMEKQMINQNINPSIKIIERFSEGDKISKADLKIALQNIYDELGLKKTAKAIDIEEYFEVKSCKIPNENTKKRDEGFKLIKKKL